MFSLKDFIKSGLLKAVGRMADYQVILNAAGWLEKGVLDEADLAEIDTAIDNQYIINEEIVPDVPSEENVIENSEISK